MGLRPRLTYANVMVTLLAFVVLCGGGAYAAGQLGRNTVGTPQLKRNAVTSAKVKDGTLRAVDFAKGLLPGGGAGQPGPAGPPGPPGSGSLAPAYQASGEANGLSTSLYATTVVTLAVPPGAYFATSSVELDSANGVQDTVQCRLIDGVGGPGSTAVVRTQTVSAAVDSFTLTGLFRVTSGESLNLQCSKGSGASLSRVLSADIVAVEVASTDGPSG